MASNLNESRASNLSYLIDFAKRINLVVDGSSAEQVSKSQEVMLKMPEEFKEEQRMSIRWTGPNFQEMIEYFKGYKMKFIELKQSSITHTNEMREILMQSESI